MEVKTCSWTSSDEGGDSVWKGQGTVCILASACVDAAEDPARHTARRRRDPQRRVRARVRERRASTPGSRCTRTSSSPSVGAGAGLEPDASARQRRRDRARLYKIDGRVAIAFPSDGDAVPADPERVRRPDRAGLRAHATRRFTLAAAGEATCRSRRSTRASSSAAGTSSTSYPGYVHVGGDINETFGGVVTLTGRTNGEFNLANGRFNFGQDIEACVLEWVFCRGVDHAALERRRRRVRQRRRARGGRSRIGGGVRFDPFERHLSRATAADGRRSRTAAVFDGKAAAAQAGGGSVVHVTIKKGDPQPRDPPRRRRRCAARARHRARRPGARERRKARASRSPRRCGSCARSRSRRRSSASSTPSPARTSSTCCPARRRSRR